MVPPAPAVVKPLRRLRWQARPAYACVSPWKKQGCRGGSAT